MDRRDVESSDWMHDGVARLYELLCDAHGGAVAGDRPPVIRGRHAQVGGRQVWTGKVVLNEKSLCVPLRWRSPRKIFVNSMSDLFQEGVPAPFVAKVWDTMAAAHWHVFQVLTKRPERMQEIVTNYRLPALANVWLGTSVESKDHKERIDLLRGTPARVRFVSFEPLLAPVGHVKLKGIHWAIVGGESGPKARAMDVAWVDEIERQCRRDGVAFFFKQWGGTNKKVAGRTYRGRVWDEFPATMTA